MATTGAPSTAAPGSQRQNHDLLQNLLQPPAEPMTGVQPLSASAGSSTGSQTGNPALSRVQEWDKDRSSLNATIDSMVTMLQSMHTAASGMVGSSGSGLAAMYQTAFHTLFDTLSEHMKANIIITNALYKDITQLRTYHTAVHADLKSNATDKSLAATDAMISKHLIMDYIDRVKDLNTMITGLLQVHLIQTPDRRKVLFEHTFKYKPTQAKQSTPSSSSSSSSTTTSASAADRAFANARARIRANDDMRGRAPKTVPIAPKPTTVPAPAPTVAPVRTSIPIDLTRTTDPIPAPVPVRDDAQPPVPTPQPGDVPAPVVIAPTMIGSNQSDPIITHVFGTPMDATIQSEMTVSDDPPLHIQVPTKQPTASSSSSSSSSPYPPGYVRGDWMDAERERAASTYPKGMKNAVTKLAQMGLTMRAVAKIYGSSLIRIQLCVPSGTFGKHSTKASMKSTTMTNLCNYNDIKKISSIVGRRVKYATIINALRRTDVLSKEDKILIKRLKNPRKTVQRSEPKITEEDDDSDPRSDEQEDDDQTKEEPALAPAPVQTSASRLITAHIIPPDFGERVVKLNNLGLSTYETARLYGISHDTVTRHGGSALQRASRVLYRTTRHFTIDMILKIADAAGHGITPRDVLMAVRKGLLSDEDRTILESYNATIAMPMEVEPQRPDPVPSPITSATVGVPSPEKTPATAEQTTRMFTNPFRATLDKLQKMLDDDDQEQNQATPPSANTETE